MTVHLPRWYYQNKNLKLSAEIISPSLLEIINISFISCQFPDSLKRSKIHPIHKGETKSDPANYRPIFSILSVISKLTVYSYMYFMPFWGIVKTTAPRCSGQFDTLLDCKLEMTLPPPPPRGNFADIVYLKEQSILHRIRGVCTL